MTDELPWDDEPELPEEHELGLPMPGGWKLRDYQQRCIAAVAEAWKNSTRALVVMPTGAGKTICFANICRDEVKRGGRVLIIAHTEELLGQAADKLLSATGLESEREKAGDHASLTASVVIASVQTISKDNRLMGFPDNHFSLVIVDESHRILAASYMKVVNYFHFGEASLDESWVMPEPGMPYKHKARVLGFTATADRGDKRSLGEFFQVVAFEYGLLDACRDGYLVRPIVKNIPLQIDLRGVKTSRSQSGSDYDAGEIAARLTPLLKAIAAEIAKEAFDRKTIIFLPSVDSARRLAEAVNQAGLKASFVSGACIDREYQVAAYRDAGPGTVLCNAMLLTEGFDDPATSCVCVLRPTKIRSLFVQCAGRASRPLAGVVDGLATKEERLAAMAASAKPNMLILDFLWLSDRLDLVRPVDLVTTRAEVADRMAAAGKTGVTDLLNLEATASRDLLKSLEEAARKHAKKAARTIDPISWAVSLHDDALAVWEPQTKWDELPATQGQLDFIRKQHIDVTNVKYRGHANKIIARLMARFSMRLATPLQLDFMRRLGIPEDKMATMTIEEASAACDATLAAKEVKRKEDQFLAALP